MESKTKFLLCSSLVVKGCIVTSVSCAIKSGARTSIARALMKNAVVLILDDSLSAVDTKTEENILEGLRENRTGRTTIYIAHRISTVKNLDKIILVDNGEIVDIGTHDELLSRCEEYQRTVKLQELEEESEGGVV